MIEDSVLSEVKETSFGLYTDHEKKNVLSVCCISTPNTLDSSFKPVTNGLYDCRMGPLDQSSGSCLTCGNGYAVCPGHPGHIELDVPVYNPLLFPSLFQLLRSKCFHCHRLRLSKNRIRIYLLKLKLIEMGEYHTAKILDDVELNDEKAGSVGLLESKFDSYEERYEGFLSSNRARYPMDANSKCLQRNVIEEFSKAALSVRRCENDCCKLLSPVIRKDGHSKIFQKPVQRSGIVSTFKTAMESIVSDNFGGEVSQEVDDSNSTSADKYLAPLEVEGQMKLLWSQSGDILNYIWKRCVSDTSEEGWRIFFTRVVLVPPNRFRPASKVGETTSEHPQNVHLMRILENNSKIRLLQSHIYPSGKNTTESVSGSSVELSTLKSSVGKSESSLNSELSQLVSVWINLQNAVNCYMDSAKDPNPLGSQNAPSGIRQLLERKEGLFRRHMMGKRVNYCCRSVISPDNYIGTNEIGIPVHFAMALHIPTPVNEWNVKYLRALVERGPLEYPGANQIETAEGRIIKLDKLTASERAGKAKLLLATPGNKVYRHLIDGDVLLVNRQPTLQKPGIMAHKARVLRFVKEQTLRMHYANCNTYNADFDGDEMNCHYVQNELARAEAMHICNNDNQYIGPTSGNPLRGLIQDHVSGGVKLTCKDTFLNRSDFQQLLFVALSGLNGTEIVSEMDTISIPYPAILKPKPLWTGKQIIGAILSHMCRAPIPALNLDGKTRTPPTAFGIDQMEHEIVFRCGELLSGVLDKNSIGSVSMGVVHAVYELYGAEQAGRLLNSFGRLFTCVLQDFGLTCGIQDLTLNKSADADRNKLLTRVNTDADVGLGSFLQSTLGHNDWNIENGIEDILSNDRVSSKIKLDGAMQSVINKSASDVIKACIPGGLEMPFLQNNFSTMVLTGAKGSAVNQSQISCFLGQQALEGQRVPLMISGKSLPSFRPYDGSARAGGFVRDRFLTGIRPQEYYFHCMAGREGLVDTAVKTSRSGYLQRCLVKHLEELKISYDSTVRDSAGNIVQFLYGEDGLDPIQAALLGGKKNQLQFLSSNYRALGHKYSLHENFLNQGLEMDSSTVHNKHRISALEHLRKCGSRNASLDLLTGGSMIWARRKIHESGDWCRSNIQRQWYTAVVIKARKSTVDIQYDDGLIAKKIPIYIMCRVRGMNNGEVEVSELPVFLIRFGLPDTSMSTLRLDTSLGAVSERMQDSIVEYVDDMKNNGETDDVILGNSFELLVWIKYMRSLACPGEAVGCVAAQSVGEPSTQMTLNTFHLAGHGGANVTLGIPRLREIIMTASKDLKTPTMTMPMLTRSNEDAKLVANKLSRIPLVSLLAHIEGIVVTEKIVNDGDNWNRRYKVALQLEKPENIFRMFGIQFDAIVAAIRKVFLIKLEQTIKSELRKSVVNVSADPLQQFRSEGHDLITRRFSVSGEDEGGGEDQIKMKKGERQESDDDEDSSGESSDDSDIDEIEERINDSDNEGPGNDEEQSPPIVQTVKSSLLKRLKFTDESLFIDEVRASVDFEFSLPASTRRLLMAQIVETAAGVSMVRSTKSISNAFVSQAFGGKSDAPSVQTEGVNFEAVWTLDESIIDMNGIMSNDIYSILLTYGVEAARLCIVNEITSVFGVYGIDVNPRHLSLIADFMTRNGTYAAMNRIGMNDCSSPFLQMSFETTCTFLNKAAFEGLCDNQQSPSARIVLGSVTKVGTGCFDLMLPLSA